MAEQTTAVERASESKKPQMVTFESLADRVNSTFDQIRQRAFELFDGNGQQWDTMLRKYSYGLKETVEQSAGRRKATSRRRLPPREFAHS